MTESCAWDVDATATYVLVAPSADDSGSVIGTGTLMMTVPVGVITVTLAHAAPTAAPSSGASPPGGPQLRCLLTPVGWRVNRRKLGDGQPVIWRGGPFVNYQRLGQIGCRCFLPVRCGCLCPCGRYVDLLSV